MTIRFLRAGIVIAAMYPAFAWAQCTVSDSADYRVEFNATWSAQTLPQEFPAGAHFSGMVGGSHNAQVTFWEEGGLASISIKGMAEFGDQGLLTDEVNVAIGAGTALDTVMGLGFVSPGIVSATFTLDQAHPLATIVSMIAPSPDWFVGVNSLNLFSSGNWLADISVELFGYDAGTDSGITYTSDDNVTQPPEAISPLTGAMFMQNGTLVPFGTFRFVRLTESCLDSDGDGDPDSSDPDDDNDGISDANDLLPLIPSNNCTSNNGNNATLVGATISAGQTTCASRESVDVSGITSVGTDGDLLLISEKVSLTDTSVTNNGRLKVINADPCEGCTP